MAPFLHKIEELWHGHPGRGGKERQVEGANSETGGRGTARVGTCPARVGTYQKSLFEDKRPKWRKGRMVAERCHFDGSRVQSVLEKGSR